MLIGDVVGLGKTLMATALARIFEDDHGLETLIICPKNLVPMWEDYRDRYRLRGRVLTVDPGREAPARAAAAIASSSSTRATTSATARASATGRSGVHPENESKCILLSATPYNKTYLDLSNQLRLFVARRRGPRVCGPSASSGSSARPSSSAGTSARPSTLAAFEKSEYADDWRDADAALPGPPHPDASSRTTTPRPTPRRVAGS